MSDRKSTVTFDEDSDAEDAYLIDLIRLKVHASDLEAKIIEIQQTVELHHDKILALTHYDNTTNNGSNTNKTSQLIAYQKTYKSLKAFQLEKMRVLVTQAEQEVAMQERQYVTECTALRSTQDLQEQVDICDQWNIHIMELNDALPPQKEDLLRLQVRSTHDATNIPTNHLPSTSVYSSYTRLGKRPFLASCSSSIPSSAPPRPPGTAP